MFRIFHRCFLISFILISLMALFYFDEVIAYNLTVSHPTKAWTSFLSELLSSVEVYMITTLVTYVGCRIYLSFTDNSFIHTVRDHAFAGFVGFFLTAVAVLSLKIFIGRVRPFVYIDEFENYLRPFTTDWAFQSFPSGNASTMGALCLLLAFSFQHLHRTATTFFVFLTLSVALLRLLSGVHYLSDVLIGYAIGAIIMAMTFAIMQYVQKHSKADLMRLIDKYIGIPICFALTLFRKVWRYCIPRNYARYNETDIKNIVFINFAELGAIVLTHSAITQARQRYPKARIYFMSFPQAEPTLEAMGFNKEKRIIIDPSSLFPLIISSLRAIWKARKIPIDTSFNTEVFVRFSTIIAYLCGCQQRVGFHPQNISGVYVGSLVTHPVLFSTQLHACEAYTSLVLALDYRGTSRENNDNDPWPKEHVSLIDRELLKLEPSSKDCDEIREKISSQAKGRLPEHPRFVILNANASDLVPLRKWPAQNYRKIAHSLLEDDDSLVVLLTGSASEVESSALLCESIASDRVVNLAAHTTFWELITLYHISSLMITNDSGPAHFASTTSLPTLVLFGPETPIIFGPIGTQQETISLFLACSPCISPFNAKSSPCHDAQCMKNISTVRVLERAKALMADPSHL